jgi:hypothetical protein
MRNELYPSFDKGSYFETDGVTPKNDLVDKVDVDRNTGWMRSKY